MKKYDKIKNKKYNNKVYFPLHAIANRRKNIFCMFISEPLTQGVDTLCAVGKPLVVKRVNKFLSLRDLFYKSKQYTLYKISFLWITSFVSLTRNDYCIVIASESEAIRILITRRF